MGSKEGMSPDEGCPTFVNEPDKTAFNRCVGETTATDDYNELPKTAQRILQDMGHYLPTKTIKDTGKMVAENISEHYGNDAAQVYHKHHSLRSAQVYQNTSLADISVFKIS